MGTEGFTRNPRTHHNTREFPPFVVDLDAGVLLRDGEPIEITPKAIAVLRVLLEHGGETVSKETLMREVWPDVSVDKANLPMQILTLRRALGEFGHRYIEAVPTRGYRFSAPVISVGPAEGGSAIENGSSNQSAQPDQEEPFKGDFAFTQPALEVQRQHLQFSPVAQKPITAEDRVTKRPEAIRRRAVAKRWTVPVVALAVLFVVTVAGYRAWSARTRTEAISETLFPGAARLGPRALTTIKVPGGADRALLSPDGVRLYLAKEGGNTLSIIDTRTNTVAAIIPIGNNPVALAVSPDGRTVYAGLKLGDITLVDVASRHVTSIHTGGNPLEDIAVTADGRTLYVAVGFSGLRKVDLATDRVSNVSSIAYARHLALTPDNRTLYVSYQAGGPGGSWGHDAIGYFDTKTDRLLGSIHGFPNVGEYLAVSPDGSQLWEDGGDACILASYDHVGCAFVPAALVNVISTRDNKLIKAVALQGVLTNSISFFRVARQ